MFNFMKAAFGSRPHPERRLSTGSLGTSTNGIDARVGKPPHARPVHIQQSALKACPTLRRQVTQGSTIVNADPIVFEVILDYLDYSGLLGKIRLNARNPLEQLIGGGDQMLKLVKAWHLAGMLNLPQLQNKLIDTFRVLYDKLLDSHIRMPLCREPFVYLRNHMGNHTKAEKFLIDFYAGLARYEGPFRAEELETLPEDISQHLRHRRAHLAVQGGYGDRIASGDPCFKVGRSDDTQRITLQVLPPLVIPANMTLFRPPPRRAYSLSTLSSILSLRSPPPSISSASPSPQNTQGRGHRPRLSLPTIMSITEHPEDFVSRALIPALQANPRTTSRPAHSRSSSTTTFSTRAPFMHSNWISSRRQSQMMADDDSSDDSSVHDLFSTDLGARNDLHERESQVQDGARIG